MKKQRGKGAKDCGKCVTDIMLNKEHIPHYVHWLDERHFLFHSFLFRVLFQVRFYACLGQFLFVSTLYI